MFTVEVICFEADESHIYLLINEFHGPLMLEFAKNHHNDRLSSWTNAIHSLRCGILHQPLCIYGK